MDEHDLKRVEAKDRMRSAALDAKQSLLERDGFAFVESLALMAAKADQVLAVATCPRERYKYGMLLAHLVHLQEIMARRMAVIQIGGWRWRVVQVWTSLVGIAKAIGLKWRMTFVYPFVRCTCPKEDTDESPS